VKKTGNFLWISVEVDYDKYQSGGIMLKLLPLVFLVSCASSYMTEENKRDVANGQKYPDCVHQYEIVFRKCVELNEKGQKVNALRTEQLMKEDKT
jgi:hypothetical protein